MVPPALTKASLIVPEASTITPILAPIPVFNEINTIEQIINLVLDQKKFILEVIIVDDCSIDGSKDILEKFKNYKNIKMIFHKKNKGKGGAIKSAVEHISGEIVIIQDADLEYSPKDYRKLIKPIKDKKYKVVYGSRVLGKNRYFNNEFSLLILKSEISTKCFIKFF